MQTGYAPVSFVLGAAVWHVPHQTIRQLLGNAGQNVEIGAMTQAVYDAREVAMTRMQAEAEREQAAGIVGVTVNQSRHVWGEHAVEFLATGTAVRPVPEGAGLSAVRPSLMVLPLSDKPVPVVGRIPTSAVPGEYEIDFEAPGVEMGEMGGVDAGADFETAGADFDGGGADSDGGGADSDGGGADFDGGGFDGGDFGGGGWD